MSKLSRTLFVCVFGGIWSTTSFSFSDANVDWKIAHSKGVEIAFRSFGEGEVLVVLNGGPGRSSESFVPLAKQLAQTIHRQVILFDQRGTGRSSLIDANEKTVTMDLMVEDLEALRMKLNVEKISILGHSFGGMYAMAYAAKYPNFISGLVLSASGGIDLSWTDYVVTNQLSRLTPAMRSIHQFWTASEQRKKDPQKARMEALRAVIPAYVFDQKFVPEVEAALVNNTLYFPKINDLVFMNLHKIRFDLKASFEKFQAPTLVIDCRQDFLGEEVPITIHKSIPKSKLVMLNGCSHYPWLDQPEAYFGEIRQFFWATNGENSKLKPP